jgi:hypothetical protein
MKTQSKSLQYYCCHEAGHAVIADSLGYQIREIKVVPHVENGSMVDYEPQPWECHDCHKEIESRHCPELLAGLDDNCASCKEEKFRFIERCFAGGAATFVLQEPGHDCGDSGFDREQVGRVYPSHLCPSTYDKPSPEREAAFSIGWDRAAKSVAGNKARIVALRDALVKKEGLMNAEEAKRVITASRPIT